MRKLLSILLMVLLTSFLVISCGEDDPKEDYTCSLQVTDGTCPEGKVCNNGQCITKPLECTPVCAATTETCNNGTCECATGFHKDGTVCVADVVECTPACGDNSTCDAGTCKCDSGFHKDGDNCVADQVSGGVGSACAADTDCTDSGAKCNTNAALPGGYCTEVCTGNLTDCANSAGICIDQGQGGSCFKKCAADTDCPRDEYVCQQGTLCLAKCTADADCGSDALECEVATGHCKAKAANCDPVTNVGCADGEACKTLSVQGTPTLMCASTSQYPFTGSVGDACSPQTTMCAATLVCISTGCAQACNDANPCAEGQNCSPLQDANYGVCVTQ